MTRILIADDSDISRSQLSAMIERQRGWTICGETRNGLKAVLLAQELKPDLVILDLVMPMLDGLRAAAEIAKLLPKVPVIIYSVEILPELELEGKKFGVWAMVAKTAGENALVETVNRLLAASQPHLLPDIPEADAELLLAEPGPVEDDDDPTAESGDKLN